MAHQVLRRYPRTTKGFQEMVQKFQYLLVMDIEATCQKDKVLKPQEIIELPCVVLSTSDWKPKDIFHTYVKPRVHPTLTAFCTELTGIMQETVDDQPYFTEVFSNFCEWLTKGGYFDKTNSSFITSGNWDLKIMLPNQCNLDGITLPDQFKQWIDLKYIFCESTGYYPKGLKDMLVRLNLPLQGRLHSGIDDVNNMISIIQTLKERHNTQFKFTSTLTSSAINVRNYEENSVTRKT